MNEPLKASIRELTVGIEEAKLFRAENLYVKLATEKERLNCQVAELRFENIKKEQPKAAKTSHQSFFGVQHASNRMLRAQADLTDAQRALLEAEIRARKTFSDEVGL